MEKDIYGSQERRQSRSLKGVKGAISKKNRWAMAVKKPRWFDLNSDGAGPEVDGGVLEDVGFPSHHGFQC